MKARRLQDWQKLKKYVPVHKQGDVCPNCLLCGLLLLMDVVCVHWEWGEGECRFVGKSGILIPRKKITRMYRKKKFNFF